jgi:hypothetical protein
VCSKAVIDFTEWEPDAIRAWLLQRQGQKVCGRFTTEQASGGEKPLEPEVNWPRQIARSALSWSKKVAAIIIVMFGITASACHNKSNEQHTRKYSADNVQLMDGLMPVIKAGVADSSSYTEDTANAQTGLRLGEPVAATVCGGVQAPRPATPPEPPVSPMIVESWLCRNHLSRCRLLRHLCR